MDLLIVYGTTEGYTRTIAERIGKGIESRGHTACVVDSANYDSSLKLDQFDAYIVAGSVHMEKHQSSLMHFVQEHLGCLQVKPSAFLSVSMSAAMDDDESRDDAKACIKAFMDQTGWRPSVFMPVAGALLYTKYDFFKRMMLKLISKKHGGPTDVSKDHLFTDWPVLEWLVTDFLARYVENEELLPMAEG